MNKVEDAIRRKLKEHERRFPLPSIDEQSLTYKNITIPLRGGQQAIYGVAITGGTIVAPFGWWCPPKLLKDFQKWGKYNGEAATRAAIEKLKKKLKKFERAGLAVSIQGDHHNEFTVSFRYKTNGRWPPPYLVIQE